MINETKITLVGNLVEDPQLRFTATGVAVASIRIASTAVKFDKEAGGWKDADTLFLTCSGWRQLAENIAESLQCGMRVIVTGRLKQRSYETAEGEKRTVFEIDADDVAPSLRNATAKVTKMQRQAGGEPGQSQWDSGGGSSSSSGGGGFGQSREPVAAGGFTNSSWGGTAATGGHHRDDPPF